MAHDAPLSIVYMLRRSNHFPGVTAVPAFAIAVDCRRRPARIVDARVVCPRLSYRLTRRATRSHKIRSPWFRWLFLLLCLWSLSLPSHRLASFRYRPVPLIHPPCLVLNRPCCCCRGRCCADCCLGLTSGAVSPRTSIRLIPRASVQAAAMYVASSQ